MLGLNYTIKVILVFDGHIIMIIKLHFYRSTSHLLLEKLDRHLWSSRPIALGPQLQAIYKSESHTPYEHTTPTSINTFIEDAGSHWGIRANSERLVM